MARTTTTHYCQVVNISFSGVERRNIFWLCLYIQFSVDSPAVRALAVLGTFNYGELVIELWLVVCVKLLLRSGNGETRRWIIILHQWLNAWNNLVSSHSSCQPHAPRLQGDCWRTVVIIAIVKGVRWLKVKRNTNLQLLSSLCHGSPTLLWSVNH